MRLSFASLPLAGSPTIARWRQHWDLERLAKIPGYRVNAGMIIKATDDDFSHCTFMSYGPDAIMNLTGEVAASKGVPETQIKKESFDT